LIYVGRNAPGGRVPPCCSGPQEQALDLSAGRALGVKPGRNNGGVVAKKRVTGPQILRQITKLPVFDPSLGPVHHKQARVVPPGDRALGDKGFRERIIKNVGLQGWGVRESGATGSNRKVGMMAARVMPWVGGALVAFCWPAEWRDEHTAYDKPI